MEKNEYLIKLLRIKQDLKDNGVYKPIPMLVGAGLIREDKKRNPNFLEGRSRNVEFLNALEQLLEMTKFE
ncbi:MAG: hypothetical protein HQ471_00305 [Flavobacteriales bacterium]|nr:hypothetical protein [Flavobacteriales bacterium]